MKKCFYIPGFLLLSISAVAQSNLDSLWSVWHDISLSDQSRLEALNKFIHPWHLTDLPILNDPLPVVEGDAQMESFRNGLANSLSYAEKEFKMKLAHRDELHRKDKTINLFIMGGLIFLLLSGGLWSRLSYIRKSQALLKKERDRAESSERIKQQFLANMSHEIRTPMNAVLGMTNLILDTSLSPTQSKYLHVIKKSSENLLYIINDILYLSKLQAGKMEITETPFILIDQIRQVKETLQYKADEKGLLFTTLIADNVPQVVRGDPSHLKQVLLNLSSNAIKFTKNGKVRVFVEKVCGTEATLHFKVQDTGIGIPRDKLDRLFVAYQQVDNRLATKYEGTGLGLSISKALVEMQQGKLGVQSEFGKGSEFSFIIPYKIARENDINQLEAEQKLDLSSLRGINVLVAEDDEFNWMVVRDTMKNLIKDATIDLAPNGKIAIDMLRKNDYHLILMDSYMPEMDGLEATRYIRKCLGGRKQQTPIVAITASALRSDIKNCMAAGMNACITKPILREELLSTLTKFYSDDRLVSTGKKMKLA